MKNQLYSFSLSLFCIILSHVTVLNHLAFALDTCDFPAIFNFGDGNSDTGSYSAAFNEAPPFYGETYFNRPAGRASNGRLMIDFMAASLGKPFLHAYLDSLGTNFSYGVNFANIEATILPLKSLLPVAMWPRSSSPFHLDIQYHQFTQFVNRSQIIINEGGVFKKLVSKKEYVSKALYTIDIGQNDITQGVLANMTFEEIKASIQDAINRLVRNLKNIYNLGGRTFWIHNTGPIGCLPFLLTTAPVGKDQMDSIGCAIPYNELAKYFNSRLREAINQLRKDLSLAAITLVDIYSAKYSLLKEPEKYGFELPLQSCCGFGGKYNWGQTTLCGVTTTVNGNQITVTPCEDPSKRISWNGNNYSEAADKVTFSKISTGEFSEPPNPLNMSCKKR